MVKLRKFLIILAILSSASSRGFHFSEPDSIQDGRDKNKEGTVGNARVCETKECHQIANAYLETINKSMDPCLDFYKFACGGWSPDKSIPKYEPWWSRIMLFQTSIENRIRKDLEKEPKPKDILPVRQAKKWFHSCMDKETREGRGIKPVESILSQAGGWPMIMDFGEWNNEELTWQEVEQNYVRLMGDHGLYEITPNDGKIYITRKDLPLTDVFPMEYRNYTAHNIAPYRNVIKRVTRLFIQHNKADISDEHLASDIDDLIEFEEKIYKAMVDHNKNASKVELDDSDGVSLTEFSEWWKKHTESGKNNAGNEIDWKNSIQQLFGMMNVKINDSLLIKVDKIGFYLKLSTILKSTDKRTIVNYIHWNFVSELLLYTTDEAKDMFFSLLKDLVGIQERPPRWRECIREMKMRDASAFMFIDKYFKKDSVQTATKMMENIKKGLKEQIENSNWISPESKRIAVLKIQAMKTFLGYPDWYKNETAVVNHYKGLIIGYDYLDNVLSYRRYQKKLQIREFLGHIGNPEWRIDPITINAIYMMGSNALYVSAADFQSPLFGTSVPDYVNYAIVGTVLGHEMSHGFDPTGIEYGSDNMTLMNENMMRMYYQQSKCFVKQFDDYLGGRTIPPALKEIVFGNSTLEPNSNGGDNLELSASRLTLNENMADTTGIQAVLSAYKKLLNNEKLNGELRLPGFEEYSDEQMFFISFAETYCEVLTPEIEKEMSRAYLSHSSARHRVNGAVSNTLDFAKSFNCPKGSSMNPEDKCNIWMKPDAALRLKNSGLWRHHHQFDIVNW